jgi:AcrR family transcriptional regulator
MAERVKTRRYDSPRRSAAAAQTRADIIEAARQLFLVSGYEQTTLGAVAKAARVSVATVKAIFANKAGLVSAVRDVAIAGDMEAIALEDRDWYVEILEERDPIAKLTAFANAITEIHVRVAKIHLLVRDAGASDQEMAKLWRVEQQQRRQGMAGVVRSMRSQCTLRKGLPFESAVATLWVLSGAETYWVLTDIGGWSVKTYTAWLRQAMVDALCEHGGPKKSRATT